MWFLKQSVEFDGELLINLNQFHFMVTLASGKESVNSGHTYGGWNFNSGNYLFTTDTK